MINKKVSKENKKPWLAALLNFFIWGLGYLYLGKRKNFGVLLIIGVILLTIIVPPANINQQLINLLYSLPGGTIVSIAFVYDAYQLAREE